MKTYKAPSSSKPKKKLSKNLPFQIMLPAFMYPRPYPEYEQVSFWSNLT